MKRATLYSSSGPARAARAAEPAVEKKPQAAATSPSRSRAWLRRHERPLYAAAGAALVLLAVATHALIAPSAPRLTQKDVQAAIERTLESRPPAAVAAYEAVRGAVVMVRGLGLDPYEGEYQKSVGSGVVVVDSGIILTNLHVVLSGERLQVTFSDGTESEAEVVSVKPEQDLAVLKATTLPDDLQAATLGSANDLRPGDEVIAVGFPFGIGPSVSSGVVSGLKR